MYIIYLLRLLQALTNIFMRSVSENETLKKKKYLLFEDLFMHLHGILNAGFFFHASWIITATFSNVLNLSNNKFFVKPESPWTLCWVVCFVNFWNHFSINSLLEHWLQFGDLVPYLLKYLLTIESIHTTKHSETRPDKTVLSHYSPTFNGDEAAG